MLSTLKPADGDECLLRVLNPTDDPVDAVVTLGLPVARVRSLRLDESPDDADADVEVEIDGSTLRFAVRPHALRTVGFTCARGRARSAPPARPGRAGGPRCARGAAAPLRAAR